MNYIRAVQALVDGEVDFVIIGGWSAVIHGSAYQTNDLIGTLDLPALIQAKRASGRAKDLCVIPELESLLEARESDSG